MQGQGIMFTGAVEAAIISAHYVLGEGWVLRLQLRRQYEDWADARAEVFTHLSTDELVDVLDGSLSTFRTALGLPATAADAGAGSPEAG